MHKQRFEDAAAILFPHWHHTHLSGKADAGSTSFTEAVGANKHTGCFPERLQHPDIFSETGTWAHLRKNMRSLEDGKLACVQPRSLSLLTKTHFPGLSYGLTIRTLPLTTWPKHSGGQGSQLKGKTRNVWWRAIYVKNIRPPGKIILLFCHFAPSSACDSVFMLPRMSINIFLLENCRWR